MKTLLRRWLKGREEPAPNISMSSQTRVNEVLSKHRRPPAPPPPRKDDDLSLVLDNPQLSLDRATDDGFDPYNTGTFDRAGSWDKAGRRRSD